VLQVSEAGAKRALLGAEPEDIARLAPGMPVQLSPVFGGQPVAAKITQVFGVIDPKTQLMDVSVEFDAASSTLLPALKVRGDIALRSPAVFVLPRDAVLSDSDGAYLFQVADGHARRIR
jgi:membrane fusion protein (multidrug efflux system)